MAPEGSAALAATPRRHGAAVDEYVELGGVRMDLNDTALAVWELCDGDTTIEDMLAAMQVLFDVDDAQLLRDVTDALRHMQHLGLVTGADS